MMGKTVLTWLKVSGWVLLLGGVLSVAHSCSTLFDSAQIWANGSTAEGKVVDIAVRRTASPNGQRRHTEAAIVQYTTAQGKVLTIEDKVGSTSSPYRVGEKVNVMYDPDEPDAALITGSIPANTVLSVFQGISGWIALVVGALLILLAKLPWVEQGSRKS